MKISQQTVIRHTLRVITLCLLSAYAMAGSTRFTVNGMVCAFCAQGIEKKLKAMPETAAVLIDLASKVVVVEPKAGQTIAASKVIHEIKQAGYDVIQVEELPLSVDEIRKDMEKKHEK